MRRLALLLAVVAVPLVSNAEEQNVATTFQKTGASVKARYTFTYKWDGKQWLITSHHSSVVPPKE